MGSFDGHISATELDSHANMSVIGKHALIISDSGSTAQVNSFAKEAGGISEVPIVDAVCAYDCPKTGQVYFLVMRNGLSVPSNEHNLVPPFLMREAGLIVNDKPKIHCQDPSAEDHTIYDKEHDLRIPLQLDGIFSYFPTRSLTQDELEFAEDYPVVLLSPDSPSWDPYNESYAKNEASFTDHRGEMLYPVPKNHELISQSDISGASANIERSSSPTAVEEFDEAERINAVISSSVLGKHSGEPSRDEVLNFKADPIRAQVSDASCVFDPQVFQASVDAAIAKSKFSEAIGATMVNDEGCELFEAVEKAFQASATAGKSRGVSPELLSKVFRIDHDTAKRTLEVTTQLNKRDAHTSLSRTFGTNDRMLRYPRIDSIFFMDTFYCTKKAKSTRGNIAMQLFVSDKGFVYVVPMKMESEIPQALKMFAKEVGVPTHLVADPARAQKSAKVVEFLHKIGTTLRLLEESTQWANRAELYIGLIKEAVRKDIRESHSPLVLWDYCAELRARMFNVTAKNLFQLQGQTPHMVTFGTEPDISNICQYKWYEWVYFRDGSQSFPFMKEVLGRYLGPAKNEGNEMTMWILKMNGQVVPRTGLRKLTPREEHDPVEVKKREAFDANIHLKLGNSFSLPPSLETVTEEVMEEDATYDYDTVHFHTDPGDPVMSWYEEGSPDEMPQIFPEADSAKDANGNPITTNSIADVLINMEVLLPQGEEKAQLARVVRRSLDSNGRHIGKYDDNPILNTAVYDLEFPDGTIKEYGANIIAENILNSIDQDGYHSQMLEGILDHEKDIKVAVPKSRKFVTTKAGNRALVKSTAGWKFKIKWKDSSTEWVPLKLLKESNPIEVAEYVRARGLEDEPAFAWWIPYTLKKRDRIIAAVNSRVRKSTHKYGIEIPNSVQDAIRIDRDNKDTFWQDAINKEMRNVGIAFKILENSEHVPPGYRKSSGHLVFDVKMDFTRKARWVKDGHRTPDPETSSYAGVVSRESIRILLTHAALHGIDIMAADIRNAYLQAPTSEKHFIICGDEFGIENVGKKALITRALYGGKCAGRDFWHHLRSCMKHMGFESSRADPDVWFRQSKKKNGEDYYEYLLLYTDDVLVISERAESVLRDEVGKYFELKEESIGKPSQYLGGKLREVELENGTNCWAFGSAQYCKSAVENVEAYLAKKGMTLQAKAPTPLSNGYRPELDVSPECGPADAAYYHSLIGILRWIVELGRADLSTEVSMMSSHLALPREGHLKEVLHIFAHLKKHHNAEIVFDPSVPEIDLNLFPREDWGFSIYGSDGESPKEELPQDMPTPLGKHFTIRVFVDADHAGECLTRRSRTGFIVFLNNAPIYWLSKKQTSCETSTFGSEFVALKQACEYVKGLRYKLRMFGIPVTEPAFVFGDNKSVLCNTTMPGSTLKKKSNAIAFHFVREGCAKDEWRTAYVNTHLNPADLMTKPLSGEKRWGFVRMLLRHICG